MNQESVFKNFCAPRANNFGYFGGARFGRKNRGRSRSCASSRARQGQGRPRHAGLALTNPSYVVRKASSCSLRSTNPSDSGHARLAVRRGTGDNWKTLPSRKMYNYLVSSDFGAETGCPGKNTGHNLKSYTEIHLLFPYVQNFSQLYEVYLVQLIVYPVCTFGFAGKSVITIILSPTERPPPPAPTIFPVFGPFISRIISGKITISLHTLCKVLYHHKNDRLQA